MSKPPTNRPQKVQPKPGEKKIYVHVPSLSVEFSSFVNK